MTIKFLGQDHTAVSIGGSSFALAAPDDWDSIVDGPTREAVKKFLAEGGVPEEADPVDPNPPVLAQISEVESKQNRAIREHLLGDPSAITRLRNIDDQIKSLRTKLK